MNITKKIYCRAVQAVFRLAMPLLPYKEPKILESVLEAADMIAQKGLASVLLVTGPHLRSIGATAELEGRLDSLNIRCAVYDSTATNPTVDNVEEARELYLKNACEAIIAFGGGSPIDCAKAVGARIAYPEKSVRKMRGVMRVRRRIPPLVAIPTTAGSGSEVTLSAVITSSESKYKYTINSFPLIPSYAVLDADVTLSMPQRVTATTGMDALTHAVEAYIGRSTTKKTREAAKRAVSLIFANIERAYFDGEDREARESMLRAAHLAGIAFSKSYVGYVHAVAHSLGGQYDIPHGLANATLLPIVLEEYGEAVYDKLHELSVSAGISVPEESHSVSAKRFIDKIKSLNEMMGIPKTLSGINADDIPVMSKHADREANPLYPVPVLMDKKELEKIYLKVSDRR